MARTHAERLLELVSQEVNAGRHITRTKARNNLGFTDAQISSALDECQDRLVLGDWNYIELVPVAPPAYQPKKFEQESELWEPIARTLRDSSCTWLTKKQFSRVYVVNSANRRSGEGASHGKWSNPDITLVFHHRFKYVRAEQLEVVTFEVKHIQKQLDITIVYEALAHRRASTMSYVFLYYPYGNPPDPDLLDVIAKECEKLGIGLIVADDVEKSERWDERVHAKRVDGDPYDIQSFIDAKFYADEKEALLTLK